MKILETGIGLWLWVVALLACGWYLSSTAPGKSRETGRVRLVVAIGAASEQTRTMYRQHIRRFTDMHPNIDVELRVVSGDYYQNLLVMLAGKVAPDLMWMGSDFGGFMDRGAFLDITDRLARDPQVNLADYSPDILRWYQKQGRQYGVPFAISTGFVAYNKTLFDAQGIAYPSDDWDFNEFLSKAQRLTIDRDNDGKIDQYGYRGVFEPEQFGARLLSEDGAQALCDTPQMIDFVQTNVDLAFKYKVMPVPDAATAEKDGLDIYSFFRQSRVAMMDFYTSQLPYMMEKFNDMDWDIVRRPMVRQRKQWATSAAILISSETKHPDEAWELCKVFFGPEFQKSIGDVSLPSNNRVADEALLSHRGKPANLKTLLGTRDRLLATPRVPNATECGDIWWRNCQSAWSGRVSPETAMKRAQLETQQLLNRARRNAQ